MRNLPQFLKRGPKQDPEFMEFVHEFGCVVCHEGILLRDGPSCRIQQSRTEGAHVGARGLGQKCEGREVLPLCGIEHHRLGPQSHHVLGKRFWEAHGLDKDKLLAELNELFEAERG